MPEQATLESSRKAAVPGKPTSEDLGGQLAFAQSAQTTFEVSCLTTCVILQLLPDVSPSCALRHALTMTTKGSIPGITSLCTGTVFKPHASERLACFS